MDYATQKRTPMGSASFYREVIARNAVVQGEFAVLHSGAVDASFRSRPVPARAGPWQDHGASKRGKL
ncbi:MAG TPA: hypothetical protein VGG82_08725 [Casimicrobiaceae bacterium]